MIKVALIVAFSLIAVAVVRSGPSARHVAVRRLITGALLCSAAAAIIYPDAVTWIAQRFGVGRGTDFLFYVFIVVWLVTWLRTNRVLVELDNKLTEVVRALALMSGGPSGDDPA